MREDNVRAMAASYASQHGEPCKSQFLKANSFYNGCLDLNSHWLADCPAPQEMGELHWITLFTEVFVHVIGHLIKSLQNFTDMSRNAPI